MHLRLLARRLTISAPNMAIRTALPWPWRWLAMAAMLGLCAAAALWAFEAGRSWAGLGRMTQDEVAQLRVQVAQLQADRARAQAVADSAESLLTAERAAQQRLASQLRTLEDDNRSLRSDLAFFEQLLPVAEGISIRSLQGQIAVPSVDSPSRLRWQVLVMQSQRNAAEFVGELHVAVHGQLAGRPWTLSASEGPLALRVRQSQRLEGWLDLPTGAIVQQVTARVSDGATTRAQQSVRPS
jgi:hypothetical protein